jgi:Flp pilus assembly protein TadD
MDSVHQLNRRSWSVVAVSTRRGPMSVGGGLALLALSMLLSACATTQPTRLGSDAITASGLYEGEPVALHATEIPVTSAGEARERARTALVQRDYDLALYLYVQAVTLDPSDTESFYAIGALHDERGNADLAARAYLQVVELDPDNALARQGLGLNLFELRQYATAERHLVAAVEHDASLWRAYNTLGILADRDERYEAAIGYYTAAIGAQPTLASIRNNRGYSRYLSGNLAAAKGDFLAALEIDPEYDRAWRNLGLVFAREKDYERALSAMTNAIERHVALNDVGYIAMLDGNYDVARALFEDAIIESPRHYQTAQDNLAELNRRSSPVQSLLAADPAATQND